MKYIVVLCFLFLKSYSQDPYKLNSLPGANSSIFIDFDGHTVNTFFWTIYNNDSVIFCQPSGLTAPQMIKIFNHVSEDFRPFNINVTTDSLSYFSSSRNKRIRIIVTPTNSWYSGPGGTAYIESFRWGNDVPCFAFSKTLLYNEKYIAEVVSHEVGHTLGLYHQARYNDTCRFLDEYNPGRGDGEIGWAPIMGNSYFKSLTTWHTGKTSQGCSFTQDDLAVISSSANGVGYRLDDYSNTIDGSFSVSFTDNKFDIGGIINTTNDIDFIKFNMPFSGRFTMNAIPYFLQYQFNQVTSNVDLAVTLFDEDSSIIGVYNRPLLVSTSIDTNLMAGTYYIKVNNTPNSNTSNYGMVGSYNLSASITPFIALPLYNISLNGVAKNGSNYIYWYVNTDERIIAVNLQYSKDNINWEEININSIDNQYFIHNTEEPILFYRLIVKLEKGDVYSSKTIFIARKQKDILYKYLLLNNSILLDVKSNANWRIIDISGRTIMSGKLNKGQGRIGLQNLKGVYLFQIHLSGQYFTEKIAL